MPPKPATPVDVASITKQLKRLLSEKNLDNIARSCGFMMRKRTITPLSLLIACVSTLGASSTQWLADILRTFNSLGEDSVQYKPFHKQLAQASFPKFVKCTLEQALSNLAIPILSSIDNDKLSSFKDIFLHDGCSFALKDSLAKVFPGRFTVVSPAAVELHVTMSMTTDQLQKVILAPDKESERTFTPKPEDVAGSLLLEDRGYESRTYFKDIQAAGGSYIIRGKNNIKPTILKAYSQNGRRLRHFEGKRLGWKVLPQNDIIDMDIEWGKGNDIYHGRLVAIYKRGKKNKKTFTYLHTNLDRKKYNRTDIGNFYRLRWQIELLFKEWKSYANLHRFDTSKSPIAEGLILVSILAATLKRFIAHATQHCFQVELSTLRTAACARHFFDKILRALDKQTDTLKKRIEEAMDFLVENAARAHPKRDRINGRLASGLKPVGVK